MVLLEARDRVGGRTFTETRDDGLWIDRGGAWIGPGQDRIYALMTGVRRRELQTVRRRRRDDVRRRQEVPRRAPSADDESLAVANIGAAFLELTQMCKAIPSTLHGMRPKRRSGTRITWARWLDNNTLSNPRDGCWRSAIAGLYTSRLRVVRCCSSCSRWRRRVAELRSRRPRTPPRTKRPDRRYGVIHHAIAARLSAM